ncbi:carbohydrate porin [Edaphobacter sp.]|uniref:carbohydrate porin n=1 Tax=Edaphobacter sp. TaxID=1934404 RepID=UPI002DB8CA52|nr:carbohydrate porin [Edaphobacter sp.]HEU5340485.1 carbohydrate porin [Edaphobacter sp.]
MTRMMYTSPRRLLAACLTILLLAAFCPAMAQTADQAAGGAARTSTEVPNTPNPSTNAAPAGLTLFPHSDNSRFLITGQANIIFQAHAPFHAEYSGINSLLNRGEYKTSLLGTLFLGAQLRRAPQSNTDVILDVESSGGRGISEALGLAGFTNLDVVRNPNLGSAPYIARVQLHQTIGFTSKLIEAQRTPFSLATQVPERRLDFRIGKMSLPDFFDINSIGTDSHLQFLNWTVDNNGAWDYAADTRGYTWAAIAEYDDKNWTARYSLALMPKVANGTDLDWNLHRANGQNIEFELRKSLLGNLVSPERKGTVRILSYVNHAHMGLYSDAVKAYLNGTTPKPDIVSVEKSGAVKYGFGLNAEQELTSDARIFTRFGWNEGQHESFAYTEVDQTFALGADYAGRTWSRPNDKLGLAFVSNAIKKDHQNYLRLGGLGFLLGDGNLNYACEDIVESYYNLHTWRGVYYALDAQYITHPGYNRDRGPVLVESIRMHIDF